MTIHPSETFAGPQAPASAVPMVACLTFFAVLNEVLRQASAAQKAIVRRTSESARAQSSEPASPYPGGAVPPFILT